MPAPQTDTPYLFVISPMLAESQWAKDRCVPAD
jgi:hypothetical protein